MTDPRDPTAGWGFEVGRSPDPIAGPPADQGILAGLGIGYGQGQTDADVGVNAKRYRDQIYRDLTEQLKKHGYGDFWMAAVRGDEAYRPGWKEENGRFWRAVHDAQRQGLIKDYGDVHDDASLAGLATEQRNADIAKVALRAERLTGAGKVSAFVGNVAASWDDPETWLSALIPIGGVAGSVAGQIVKQGLKEAAVNAGTALVAEPFIRADAARLGVERDWRDTAYDVGAQAGFGLVLGGAAKGADLYLTDRAAAKALREAVPDGNLTPDERAAIHVIERTDEIAAASPYVRGPAGDDAHFETMDRGMRAAAAAHGADVAVPPRAPRTRPIAHGGGVADDIVSFFRGRGYSEAHARGIAAGIHAEAASNHGARNPDSGAFGLGQWLGSRKAELFRRYGPRPTREQQLEFLHWELQGGDHGGRAVLRAGDEASVLSAYIHDFMRPAKGAETAGDLSRGMAALGRAGEDMAPVRMADAGGEAAMPMPDPFQAARVEMDLPELRRDLFPDERSWRIAQAASDDAYLGISRDDPLSMSQAMAAPPPVSAMRAAATLDEARGHAESFIGAAMHNAETGLAATVSRATLRKMTSASAVRKSTTPADHALAIANVDELFPRARLVESGADARGEPTIAGIHRYHATMQTAGGMVDVRMTVKETTAPQSPNPLYTVETIAVEPARKAPTPVKDGGEIERAPGQDRNAPQTGSAPDIGGGAADVHLAARGAARFDDPHGAAATEQAMTLTHDVQAAADAGELNGLDFAAAGMVTRDGQAVPMPESVKSILSELDAEDAAIAAIRACL